MVSKQAYDMLMQDLNAQIKQGGLDKESRSEAKAGAQQASATASGDLEDTTGVRDADTKYLKDLTAECGEKSTAFEQRQQLRAEEIEAIEKAIEIISSGAVSGAADKHLPALIQKHSLAQLRSSTSNPAQQRVATYLQEQGKVLHSRVLTVLAQHATADPFAKV